MPVLHLLYRVGELQASLLGCDHSPIWSQRGLSSVQYAACMQERRHLDVAVLMVSWTGVGGMLCV